MLKENDFLFENLGKICLFSVAAFSVFALTKAFLNSKNRKVRKYERRLRMAYDGLSPEDYSEDGSAKR